MAGMENPIKTNVKLNEAFCSASAGDGEATVFMPKGNDAPIVSSDRLAAIMGLDNNPSPEIKNEISAIEPCVSTRLPSMKP